MDHINSTFDKNGQTKDQPEPSSNPSTQPVNPDVPLEPRDDKMDHKSDNSDPTVKDPDPVLDNNFEGIPAPVLTGPDSIANRPDPVLDQNNGSILNGIDDLLESLDDRLNDPEPPSNRSDAVLQNPNLAVENWEIEHFSNYRPETPPAEKSPEVENEAGKKLDAIINRPGPSNSSPRSENPISENKTTLQPTQNEALDDLYSEILKSANFKSDMTPEEREKADKMMDNKLFHQMKRQFKIEIKEYYLDYYVRTHIRGEKNLPVPSAVDFYLKQKIDEGKIQNKENRGDSDDENMKSDEKSDDELKKRYGEPRNLADQPENFDAQPENFVAQPKNVDAQPENFGGKPDNFDSRPENLPDETENMSIEQENQIEQPQNLEVLPKSVDSKPDSLPYDPNLMADEPIQLSSEHEDLPEEPEIESEILEDQICDENFEAQLLEDSKSDDDIKNEDDDEKSEIIPETSVNSAADSKDSISCENVLDEPDSQDSELNSLEMTYEQYSAKISSLPMPPPPVAGPEFRKISDNPEKLKSPEKSSKSPEKPSLDPIKPGFCVPIGNRENFDQRQPTQTSGWINEPLESRGSRDIDNRTIYEPHTLLDEHREQRKLHRS